MFCPYCGAESDETYGFCPYCGTRLSFPSVSVSVQAPKKSKKAVHTALVVALILISASLAGLLYWVSPSGQPFEADEYVLYGSGSVATGVIQVSDYEDGDPNDGSCAVTFTCSANTFTGYVWGIRSLDESLHYESGDYIYTRQYEMPADAELSPDGRSMSCKLTPGHYSVKVETNMQEYVGSVVLQGKITRNYSWSFDRSTFYPVIDFELNFTFSYGECLDGIRYGGARAIYDSFEIGNMVKDYSAPSGLTDRLQTELRALYTGKYGEPGINDPYYAQFLLTFVQVVFSYPPTYTEGGRSKTADDFVYGKSEYWAFPSELIVQGQGDCEDTSFLCAVLFKAAGFDTAVAMLPGHAMAGVAVPKVYSKPSGSYEIKQTVAGITYYGCETTANQQYPTGYTGLTYTDFYGVKKPLSESIPSVIDSAPAYGDGFYPI